MANGKKMSEETRRKISESRKGRKYSEASKKKMSESKKRNWRDPAFREKLKDRNIGGTPWNKGAHIKLNDALDKWRDEGGEVWNKGVTGYSWGSHSDETRRELSRLAKERIQNGTHNFIDNGVTDENKAAKNSIEYKLWRKNVFERDDYTCQAHHGRGGRLHPHHILNFKDNKDDRFNITNGVTLCEDCHKKFHSYYSTRNNNEEQLREFIEIINQALIYEN